MRIRRITARSMAEALKKVRAELGEDAVILHSKTISAGGLLGLLSTARVEVTAAADVVPPEEGRKGSARGGQEPSFGRRAPREFQDSLHRLEQQVAELAVRLEGSEGGAGREPMPPEWASYYRALSERGIPRAMAEAIVLAASRDGSAAGGSRADAIRRVVEGRFKTCAPIQAGEGAPTVAVFIGPTGVGKTTTLAKIAAGFAEEGRRVALVTADTYRLAAVEQLRRFAEIMELPVEVAYEPREAAEALQRHRDADIILVDTAGRSQNHASQMGELGELLGRMPGAEAYLVLAVTTAAGVLRQQIRRFEPFGARKVILTKIDEAPCGGSLLEAVSTCPLPIAYVTNGQEIPEDVQTADAAVLARLAIAGEAGAERGGTYARVG